jgi:hypothetical protein
MKNRHYLNVIILSLLVMGCSTNRNLDYLKSKNGPKLVVNTPLNKRQIDESFTLANVGDIKAKSIKPPVLR